VAINIGRRLGRGWRGPEFAATLAELHAAGDAAIAAASDELFQGNANDDREALLARMALIDFLGVAARANRHARERLFGFALSPLPVSDDPRLMHLDATDRLEAFVYVAALAPSVAARHVKRQPGPLFKSRYVVQFVAGREYAGATRDQAIQEAYDLFRRDGELAHLSTHNQDPETFSP
jgi:hypothetical protein